MMTMHKAISDYLNAVENKFGVEARSATKLVHHDGSIFILKRHTDKNPSTVMLGDLQLMIKQLERHAQRSVESIQ